MLRITLLTKQEDEAFGKIMRVSEYDKQLLTALESERVDISRVLVLQNGRQLRGYAWSHVDYTLNYYICSG